MLKERYGNFINMWIISIILLFLSISIIIIHPTFDSNNILVFLVALVISIMLISGFGFFMTSSIGIIFITIINYIDKKSYLKSIKEIQNLPNEFTEVTLKNNNETSLSKFIPNDEIKCLAKLDDNGNIIYKIHVDIESSTTNYESFLKEFII